MALVLSALLLFVMVAFSMLVRELFTLVREVGRIVTISAPRLPVWNGNTLVQPPTD